MQYQERQPTPEVAAVIKHFWSLEYDGIGAVPETILPDGCPELVFNLADRFRRIDGHEPQLQPATLFAGQISRSITIAPTGRVKLFGVRFTPTGAFAICRWPQVELRDAIFEIGSLLGREGEILEDAVNDASNFEERIALFEEFVRGRVVGSAKTRTIAGIAADLVMRRHGNISVARLSETLNRSERCLERDFREQVGLSPKTFARIVRFQNVVRSIESSSEPAMLETALSFGYFDQSHMIRDFREFSGKSPREYFNATHRMSALFTAAA